MSSVGSKFWQEEKGDYERERGRERERERERERYAWVKKEEGQKS